MVSSVSGPRLHLRSRGRWAAAAALALANLVGLAGWSASPPAVAADKEPVVGKDELIGKLIPITGDPLERRSVDLRIEFRKNSAEIGESAAAQLRELGGALVSEALREVPVGVYGHTDTGGPADYNRALSERRARAVADWLREHFALAVTRFREVRGFGEERPREELPPTDPAQRRVEIVTFHKLWAAEPPARESEPGAPVEAPPDRSDSGLVVIGADGASVPGREEPAAGTLLDEGGEGKKKRKKLGGIVVIE